MSFTNNKLGIPDEIMNAIQEVLSCNTMSEHLAYYGKNRRYLKDCIFLVYSENEGQFFPKHIQTDYTRDFAIVELGCANRYFVIDDEIYTDMMLKGKSDFALDLCVELDTQVVSYFKRMFVDFNNITIKKELQELLRYLKRKDVDYSIMLYLVENAKKITEECYLSIRSNEIFKALDLELFLATDEIRYYSDKADVLIKTDRAYCSLISGKLEEFMEGNFIGQSCNFCILSKAIMIENKNPQKSAKNKMIELIDFVNDELGVYCERELAICYYYFSHDKNTEKFFKKTKANSKSLLQTINGMAWDLTHIRFIESLYGYCPLAIQKLAIHLMLTFDNGLKEILKLYPIEKIVIYQGTVLPIFKTKFQEIFPEIETLMFTVEKVKKRTETYSIEHILEVRKYMEEMLTNNKV